MEQLKKIWNEDRYRIPAQIIAAYLLWKLFHHFANMPGTRLNHFWIRLITYLGSVYAVIVSFLVRPFVDSTYAKGVGIFTNVGVNYRCILVHDHCLAIPAIVVFTATVLFFRGRATDKLWFIPLGWLGICIINTIRLFLVVLAWQYLSKSFFDLHHSFIYVVLCYGFIFMMLAWWIKRNKTEEPIGT